MLMTDLSSTAPWMLLGCSSVAFLACSSLSSWHSLNETARLV